MAAKLWSAATSNAFNTTLNGSIGAADAIITLNSVTGLQTPGVLVIDRTDGAGNSTASVREYVTYTGINGSQVTGVVRGVAGSTAQSHSSGAQVEEVMSITHWNDLVTFLQAEHDSTGHHVIGTATINYTETKQLAVTSIASIAQLVTGNLIATSIASLAPLNILAVTSIASIAQGMFSTLAVSSLASLQQVYITNNISASGASVQGMIGVKPVWVFSGTVSAATTALGFPVDMPLSGTIQFISAITRIGSSNASLFLDVIKNGTTVLTGANASQSVLMIPINGTFVSTNSIAVPRFVAGDVFNFSVLGINSMAQDLVVKFFAR